MKKIYFLLLTFLITSASFAQVIITEIADPNNNANARYIELHNLGATAVNFTEGAGWQIDKYLNGNTGVNISIDLTGSIPAGGFYLIAYDAVPGTFVSVYGMTPDQLDAVSNGVAGSNGDDDLALVDGTDTIVDFWGVYDFGTPMNTDNTGTCAEYEDGRAERLTSVTTGNAAFNEAEWNVWADSAVTGCTSHVLAPRTAPGDFDPGAWGTPTCGLSMSNASATCDAITAATDTYTATIDFTGGGTASYTVSADSGTVDLTNGDPTNDVTGTITVNGVTEGVDVIVTVSDGAICNVMNTISAASCVPALPLPHTEDFTYADGSLINSPDWMSFSGTSGDLLVSSGQAVVQHGTPSEDARLAFTPAAGDLYFAFDLSVINPGGIITGGDYEYFAFFKDDGFAYGGRVSIAEALSGGDFTVGIATNDSTEDAVWATDLSFGSTYRVTVRYNQDTNTSELWIDAASASDTSILGDDQADPGIAITQFGLRQSDSSLNEGILIDNLTISTTFNETLSTDNFSIENKFKIFPNPTNSGFVNITTTSNEALNVNVFDILGKEVLSQTVNNNTLNVSSLKTGVYILKLNQNGATTTKKLVIK